MLKTILALQIAVLIIIALHKLFGVVKSIIYPQRFCVGGKKHNWVSSGYAHGMHVEGKGVVGTQSKIFVCSNDLCAAKKIR